MKGLWNEPDDWPEILRRLGWEDELGNIRKACLPAERDKATGRWEFPPIWGYSYGPLRSIAWIPAYL